MAPGRPGGCPVPALVLEQRKPEPGDEQGHQGRAAGPASCNQHKTLTSETLLTTVSF